MPEYAPKVTFTAIAREWRCKWSQSNDKASLTALQETLEKHIPTVKKVPGFIKMQRVVCGDCSDFKVITSIEADKFAAWKAAKFAPEENFLNSIKKIPGVDLVETQSYTFSDV